jgi:hypothetical protein
VEKTPLGDDRTSSNASALEAVAGSVAPIQKRGKPKERYYYMQH